MLVFPLSAWGLGDDPICLRKDTVFFFMSVGSMAYLDVSANACIQCMCPVAKLPSSLINDFSSLEEGQGKEEGEEPLPHIHASLLLWEQSLVSFQVATCP